LNLKIYPFESKNNPKFSHDKTGYYICAVTDTQPFLFPDRWRGLEGQELVDKINCEGALLSDKKGGKILCENMSSASMIAAIAFDKIKSDYLNSRFMNIVAPGVLVFDKYFTHWQSELFQFERKLAHTYPSYSGSVAEDFVAKLVIFPSENVLASSRESKEKQKLKWVIKTIKTKEFYENPENTSIHEITAINDMTRDTGEPPPLPTTINDPKQQTRFIFPKALRGKTLSQFINQHPDTSDLFDMFGLNNKHEILFDISGHAATCGDIEDAKMLAMGVLDYWPSFERYV